MWWLIQCSGHIVIVQSLNRVQLFATPWTAVHQASLSFTISQSLLKIISIELVILSNHLILHPRQKEKRDMVLILLILKRNKLWKHKIHRPKNHMCRVQWIFLGWRSLSNCSHMKRQNMASPQKPTLCSVSLAGSKRWSDSQHSEVVSPAFVLCTNGIISWISYCVWRPYLNITTVRFVHILGNSSSFLNSLK